MCIFYYSLPTIGGLRVIRKGCYLVTEIKTICMNKQYDDLLSCVDDTVTPDSNTGKEKQTVPTL